MSVALVAMAASLANADSAAEWDAEAKRWSVALALTGGFTFQNQFGRILPRAEVISFTPGTKEPAPLRPPSNGRYAALNPYFGVNLEVMAPAIEWLWGDPRFFVNGEILPSFTSTGSAALEGAATGFKLPEKIGDQPQNYPQEAITGTGSRLSAQMLTMAYAVSLGASFPVEVRGRLVRIKPSVGWIHYGVRADGVLYSAFKDDPDPPITQPPLYGFNTRFVALDDAAQDSFNALGPGLEIEMELPRWRDFRPSLYIDGHAYRVIGNQTIAIDETVSFQDVLVEATYTTDWVLTVADWMGRAGVGFRMRWVGL